MHDTSFDLKIFLQDPDPWSPEVKRRRVPSILPPGSARYCTQTLRTQEPLETFCPPGSQELKTYALHGDVNAFKRYTCLIEGKDHYLPAYAGLWPRTILWIYSAVRMMVLCEGDTPLPLAHVPLPESMIFHHGTGQEEFLPDGAWNPAKKTLLWGESGFISYVPILKMRVQSMTLSSQEGEALSPWTLALEEV